MPAGVTRGRLDTPPPSLTQDTVFAGRGDTEITRHLEQRGRRVRFRPCLPEAPASGKAPVQRHHSR